MQDLTVCTEIRSLLHRQKQLTVFHQINVKLGPEIMKRNTK